MVGSLKTCLMKISAANWTESTKNTHIHLMLEKHNVLCWKRNCFLCRWCGSPDAQRVYALSIFDKNCADVDHQRSCQLHPKNKQDPFLMLSREPTPLRLGRWAELVAKLVYKEPSASYQRTVSRVRGFGQTSADRAASAVVLVLV